MKCVSNYFIAAIRPITIVSKQSSKKEKIESIVCIIKRGLRRNNMYNIILGSYLTAVELKGRLEPESVRYIGREGSLWMQVMPVECRKSMFEGRSIATCKKWFKKVFH